jgi:transcription elongation factor GreA
MDKIENLIQVFKAGKWDEGTSIWLETLEQGIKNLEPLRKALQELWRSGQKELLQQLLHITTNACAKTNDPALLVHALRLVADYNPAQKGLTEEFANGLKKMYKEHQHLSRWIDKVLAQNLPPAKFIQMLEKLVVFHVGTIVKHKSGWGIGKVTSISEEKMELIVDLEKRPNHRMDVLAAGDCLIPIEADSFEAMVVYQPEQLKEEAQHEPLKLVYKILKTNAESVSARELKQYLCPEEKERQIIEEKQWSKWWTKVRKLLIADPYIEVSSEVNAKYTLRDKPIEWEDEIMQSFTQTLPLDQPGVVLDYLKTTTTKRHLNYFAQLMAKACSAYQQAHKPWYALETYLVLEDCLKQGSIVSETYPSLTEIFAGNPISIFSNMRMAGLAQRTLESFIHEIGDEKWPDYIEPVFKKGSDLARDTLFKYLNKHQQGELYLPKICKEIMSSPLQFPDALIWFAKQIINERVPQDESIPNLISLFDSLIQTVATYKSLRQTESVKKIIKLFSLSFANKLSSSVNNPQSLSVEQVQQERKHAMHLSRTLENTQWLPSAFKDSINTHIREFFPDLYRDAKHIYTTKVGLDKKQRELQDLVQTEMSKNSKDIGEALAFGDISENAELDAAREKQFQLTKKAQEMKAELARAVLIDFENISTEEVSVGTTVKLANVNDAKEEIVYTILGPWDVDLQNNIISHMTQIAKALLKHKRSNEVALQGKTYRIVDIFKYQDDNRQG